MRLRPDDLRELEARLRSFGNEFAPGDVDDGAAVGLLMTLHRRRVGPTQPDP